MVKVQHNLHQNYYRYSRLQENKIRLLRVIPMQDSTSQLECFVEYRDIPQGTENPDPGYIALSWRPGSEQFDRYSSLRSPVPSRPRWNEDFFIMDGQDKYSLSVDPSLQLALKQLRETEEPIFVWVEQICINQTDEAERTSQGDLIPTIFEHADGVVVWLGEGDEDSKTAIQFIPSLLNLSLIDSLVKKESNPWKDVFVKEDSTDALVKEESTPVKWQALINLMQRPYFARRWVFLEVMLAKQAVLCCGEDTIDWGDFADAVVILGSRYDDVKLLVRDAMSSEYVATLQFTILDHAVLIPTYPRAVKTPA